MLSIGLLRRSAGDTISDIYRVFTCFFLYGLSFNGKSLPNMREVEVAIELGGNPYFASFNSAVVRWVTNNEIGQFAILEV